MKHLPLEPLKSKRKPMSDCSTQLALLGVHAAGTRYVGHEWLVEPTVDSDYPWTLIRRADGAFRRCCSLMECVAVIKDPAKHTFEPGGHWGVIAGGRA